MDTVYIVQWLRARPSVNQTYRWPCPPLNLVEGMRMGSSSLSSESGFPRAGGPPCPPAPCGVPSGTPSPGGSSLRQPPDVSSMPSGGFRSRAGGAPPAPWGEASDGGSARDDSGPGPGAAAAGAAGGQRVGSHAVALWVALSLND